MSIDFSRDGIFVNGEMTSPHSKIRIEITAPRDGSVLGTLVDADSADVDMAVHSARDTWKEGSWRERTVEERATTMERLAELLDQHHQSLSLLLAYEIGRPIGSTTGRPNRAAELLRYYAAQARTLIHDEIRPVPEKRAPGAIHRSIVRLDSRGVTGVIVPYNGTLEMGLYKIGPTLALGGSVVFKPAPEASLEAFIFAELAIEAGIPPGTINVVSGGRQTGRELVIHPGVDIVGFTGSSEAGKEIGELCGRLLKPAVLELGGKSAALLMDDVDPQTFAAAIPYIGFTFSGQNCFIHSRILIPEKKYAEISEAIVESVQELRIGDPLDPMVQFGPLISQAHRIRVERYIALGVSEGATLLSGGGRPAGLERGWFIEPTIFTGAKNSMAICREEIFGPVLALIPYRDEVEALSIANDSEFGLAGSVWGVDEDRALALAERIDSGTVGINGYGFNSDAPLAGRRKSGVGTELGREGFLTYARYKSLHFTH